MCTINGYQMHGCSPEVIPEEIRKWGCWTKVLVVPDGRDVIKHKPTVKRIVIAYQSHCGNGYAVQHLTIHGMEPLVVTSANR